MNYRSRLDAIADTLKPGLAKLSHLKEVERVWAFGIIERAAREVAGVAPPAQNQGTMPTQATGAIIAACNLAERLRIARNRSGRPIPGPLYILTQIHILEEPMEETSFGDVDLETAQRLADGLVQMCWSAERTYSLGITTALAMEINPDAGQYPVPLDPEELEVAIQGGRIGWEQFPYYAARYGDRGLSFTLSDSAWLVSLLDSGEDRATAQITWLSGLLSARGMPRWLMEMHLRILYPALAEARPERHERYALFLRIADGLANDRRRFVSDHRLDEATEWFRRRAPNAERIPEAGALIASAWADRASGIGRSVISLQNWLGDASLFGSKWTKAFTGLLNELNPSLH